MRQEKRVMGAFGAGAALALMLAWPATPALAAAKISTAVTPVTEIHGLPDPVAAARRDASLRQAGHRFGDGAKPVACRYPAMIDDAKLIGCIHRESRLNDIDPRLVYALIEQESRFNPKAVSPKGAQGLMQIMPDTQRLLGLKDPFDPEKNIAAGVRYLKAMLKRFTTEVMALAAYNAGPEAVARHGGVPPFEETKDYVLKVVDRYFFLKLKYPAADVGVIHRERPPAADDADG